MRISRVAVAATLAVPLLVACSGGGPDPEVARLRGKLDAQTGELEAMAKRLAAMETRARLLEEQAGAVRPGSPAGTAAAPAKPAEGAVEGTAEPLTGAVAVTAEAVGTYLDTEQGKVRIREAIAAEEKRREEEARSRRREQSMAFIKERVSGSLADALGLDAKQQQTVITIAADTMEKMEEIWRGARDGGTGNTAAFAEMRTKTQETMAQAQEKLQQALSVEQYTKLQELNAEGNGLMPGRGMGGFGGFGGPGGRNPGGTGGGGTPAPGGGR